MDRDRFASAYDRKTSASPYLAELPPETQAIIQPFEAWSHTLGDALFKRMIGHDEDDFDTTTFRQYETFVITHNATLAANKIEQSIMENTSMAEDARQTLSIRALQTHNFHVMSQFMSVGWYEMLAGDMSGSYREQFINLAQFGLAHQAVEFAKWRQEHASIASGHDFYSEEHRQRRAFTTGVLSEIDAAITLLEISRRDPNILVVPAPKRFEDSSSEHNADFIIYHKETNEVAGVQVKTRVTDEHRERYDTTRIALIDSVNDMGGTVWTRVQSGKSVTKPVPWPGMVSFDYLSSIKLHGKRRTGFENFNPKVLLNIRRNASDLLTPEYDSRGKLQGSLSTAVQNVREIILPYLHQEEMATDATHTSVSSSQRTS